MRGKPIYIKPIRKLLLTCLLFPIITNALTFPKYLEQSSIKGRILYYAIVKGVDPDLALYIFQGESNFEPKEIGDMDITCKRTGLPVRSRGLAQISECYYPNISDQDAFDPDFSILWAIPKMKNEKLCKMTWTVCRTYSPKVLIGDIWAGAG